MSAPAVPSLLYHVRRLAAVVAPPSSDEQLLADFVTRRSDRAFAALVERHGPMVLNVCRRILHDQHLAEDVFQATFLVLADRAGAIRRRAALAGFLHGVAYRLAVRARQRKQHDLLAVKCDSATVCDKAAEPPEGVAWKEMLAILDHELSQLSERCRAPLVLCYLEGRTQDEAARQLGWSLNTLRRRLTQGRRLLEARLHGRGVTLSSALAGLLASSTAAVPAPVQAATQAAAGARLAGARLAGGVAASASVLSSARNGIALFFSTFSTPILSAALTFGIFVVGHFSTDLRNFDQVVDSPAAVRLARGVYWLLPNLAQFDVKTQVVHGQAVPLGYLAMTTAYAALYAAMLLTIAVYVFSQRDFK